MNISTKLLQAAAGSAGVAGLDVDEVFKNFLYVGAGATKIIENGIALGSVITEVALTGKTITNLGSSFEGSYPLSNVNDGTVETSNGQNTAYTTGTFDIYVDMGLAVIVDAYLLAPQGDQGGSTYNNPTGLTVSGSNNASSWTTIATFSSISGFSPGTFKTFEFTNTTAYRYYRLAATNTGVSISEWKVRTNDNTGSGGLVWIKERSRSSTPHSFYDTERGARYWLTSNQTYQQYLQPSGKGVTGFNSNGFTLGTDYNGSENANGQDVVSWTFRKAPRFFDIQTWTGNSASDRAISHNLDAVPGMIIVKRLNSSEDWGVWHRDVHANTTKVLYLNKTDALTTSSSIFGATNPTSTNFYVGNHPVSNNNGDTYVAYIFAHNNGDGEFGPDSDQDIIKCGSFSTDSSGNATVNLGFEPQWLMVKSTSNAYGWEIYDQMRGFGVTGHAYLFAHAANAEGNNSTGGTTQPTNTGFSIGNNYWGAGVSFIYMAIRRGPLAEPTDATKVFAIDTAAGTSPSPPHFTSGFPVDFAFYRDKSSTADWYAGSRLNRTKYLKTNATDAETSDSALLYDYQNGFNNANWTSANTYAWMWKRAPGYFDVCTWTGTGNAITINHNLGAVPKMIWVKRRDSAQDWIVYHSGNDVDGDGQPWTDFLRLDSNQAGVDADYFNDTAPTATTFQVKGYGPTGSSGGKFIAVLFGEVAGVSKLGSYTGNDTGQNINCGFSSGARFVLIKCSSHGDRSWMVFDSTRGIVAGADPFLTLEANSAENYASNGAGSIQNYTSSNLDLIDPYSSGFAVVGGTGMVNENGKKYIFYAIA